jgi:hypothetical protein
MLFASCFRAMQDARSDLEEAMEVAAHVTGVAQVTGKLGPAQMMLCKPDLSDKHMRWFLIDADACTIEWAKKVRPPIEWTTYPATVSVTASPSM